MKNIVNQENKCLHCGALVTIKYCNARCQRAYEWSQTKEKIEDSGEFFSTTPSGLRKQVKKYLLEKHGHRCEICMVMSWGGKPVTLISDHIDGDQSNNKIDNFRLICSNCDATLPTYKIKNVEHQRRIANAKRNI